MRSRKRRSNEKHLMGWMAGVLLLVLVLISVILFHEKEGEGMNRALAVKSMVLALQSPEALAGWRQQYGASHFPADSLDEWYVPYFDYLYEEGGLSEEETPAGEAAAQGYLTYGEAARMAGQVSPRLAERIGAGKKNRDRPYPEELWWLFYDSLLKEADPDGAVEKREVCIYGTSANVPGTAPWKVHTNRGEEGFGGLALDGYMDHQLLVYARGDEIIHVIEDEGSQVTYRNVWLIDGDEEGLQVYVGDIERRFSFAKKSGFSDSYIRSLADLQLDGGKIVRVSVKKDRIQGKLLSICPDSVEIEGYGPVPLDEECKILKIYGDLERQRPEDVLVGYDMQEFVAAKGKICAILTVRPFEAETIRVLVMNGGFRGLYHEQVTLACDRPMTVTQGKDSWKVEAGTEVSYRPGDEKLAGGRMIFTAEDGGEIRVCSLERSLGQPAYGGRLELVEAPEGLVLVNELYLEDYLKKVIPSEMPSSYEKEALKAQAVCARTYAYTQIQSNTYCQYGAHVDDSTRFQVYNNVETDERTGAAVEETYGKMLFYEDNPISAYYFSTSCGTTSDGSAWGSDPADTPYLQAVSLGPGRKKLDLSSNEAFSSFIRDEDYPAYDDSFPFYRWRVTTNADILTAHIGGVGTVESVAVTERGPGGIALKMRVKGSEGEKTISGESSIRAALGDGSLTIRRKDGSTVTGWSSLPSAFLTVEDIGENDSGARQFVIYGGGYGHGVGMSQNGAQAMAKKGMEYREILDFFYRGAELR